MVGPQWNDFSTPYVYLGSRKARHPALTGSSIVSSSRPCLTLRSSLGLQFLYPDFPANCHITLAKE